MKGLGIVRWAGLAAVIGGMFMTFSDLMNLTVHVPGLGEASHTGYQAVGSGVILLALTLLFVGMVGLFAGSARVDGPEVIEYGGPHARYVLVESDEKRAATFRPDAGRAAKVAASGHHRTARRTLRV